MPAQMFRAQNADYRFGVKVELVSLFATVHDRSGKLVTGLARDDFVLFDEGVAQTISQFSSEYVPLSVIILLDCSGSMQSGKKLEHAKTALRQFLKRLQAGDEAMLIAFRTRPQVVQPFTQDLGRLKRGLKRLEANGSTGLYDAILAALEKSRSARNRRRTLLLISDGINNYGKAHLQETVTQLQRQGVELFAIGLESNMPEDFKDNAVTRTVLDNLTRRAGGEAFMVSNSRGLSRMCATISDRMHNQYAFIYYAPPSKDGLWRSVRLVTKNPALRVIASKTGYFAAPYAETRPPLER